MVGIPQTAETAGKARKHAVYSSVSWKIFPRFSEERIRVCQVSQARRSTKVPSSENVLSDMNYMNYCKTKKLNEDDVDYDDDDDADNDDKENDDREGGNKKGDH